MHIVTGLLLAGLAGIKRNGQGGSLPGFSTGPVQTLHVLPGRVRFKVPSLKDDKEGCDALAKRLGGVEGIESVQVSAVTGSVLVLFDAAEVKPELLFAAIVRLLGLEDEVDNPPPPLVARELNNFARSLNRAVYEKTGGVINLWTGLMIALAAYGVRRAMVDGTRAWPAGFTMVWWAVNALGRQRNNG